MKNTLSLAIYFLLMLAAFALSHYSARASEPAGFFEKGDAPLVFAGNLRMAV